MFYSINHFPAYHVDVQYFNLLNNILNHGSIRKDRTGVGTKGIFGTQQFYDLTEGFPLLTTKKMHWKSIVHELIWFLNGDTNIKYLKDNGVSIWDEWADENGDLGPVYGSQWRQWKHSEEIEMRNDEGGSSLGFVTTWFDQISKVIGDLKTNPFSRRHIVTAWNPAEVNKMALPPCHLMFQFYVHEDPDTKIKWLDLQMYQRSADVFLGVPFNIASYALLLTLVAEIVDMRPRQFIHTIGDAHIYLNHMDQVEEQLSRKACAMPKVEVSLSKMQKMQDLIGLKFENITLIDYYSQPTIKAPIAV